MLPHPFHKASFRPHMLMGAERKPMLVLMMTCGGLVLTSYNMVAVGIAIGLWVVVHPLLLYMGKIDPDMVNVYFRSQRYPKYIPAFSTPFRKAPGYVVGKESKLGSR